MHSCSRGAQLAISIIGGFVASLLAITFAQFHSSSAWKGQLLAGDPTLNRDMPTTLNAFKNAADGTQTLMQNLSSPLWWAFVIGGGIIAAFIIFKILRKYV